MKTLIFCFIASICFADETSFINIPNRDAVAHEHDKRGNYWLAVEYSTNDADKFVYEYHWMKSLLHFSDGPSVFLEGGRFLGNPLHRKQLMMVAGNIVSLSQRIHTKEIEPMAKEAAHVVWLLKLNINVPKSKK